MEKALPMLKRYGKQDKNTKGKEMRITVCAKLHELAKKKKRKTNSGEDGRGGCGWGVVYLPSLPDAGCSPGYTTLILFHI